MRQVMLVEDEEMILEGLKNIIDWDELNMNVKFSVHNGKEAIEILEHEKVDIIVTDINMPIMDGLTFLTELRKKDVRARCILLTGYEEFEYAKKAIQLEVEDYILKPINEDKLIKVLINADKRLQQIDEKYWLDIKNRTDWLHLLTGKMSEDEMKPYIECLPVIQENVYIIPALMKLSSESLTNHKLLELMIELQNEKYKLTSIYIETDLLFLLFYTSEEEHSLIIKHFEELQYQLESKKSILTFICIGKLIKSYDNLAVSFEEGKKLLKYQLIEGYGGCISYEKIDNQDSMVIEIDESYLRKLLIKKDKEGSIKYIEDLFIKNMNKDVFVDDIYQLSLKTAMILQEIKREYQLANRRNIKNLTEMLDQIYQAEDMFALKSVFTDEIIEIIQSLNENNSQYTPVVKQIVDKVQKNYKEDMNLKTLAYKYHMNASYLGQIFQKEIGCSFSQYLSNTKNEKAKNLILNTNMKINDIAREVGYYDTSYFYRKFKQCYGVSPASLREMKKY